MATRRRACSELSRRRGASGRDAAPASLPEPIPSAPSSAGEAKGRGCSARRIGALRAPGAARRKRIIPLLQRRTSRLVPCTCSVVRHASFLAPAARIATCSNDFRAGLLPVSPRLCVRDPPMSPFHPSWRGAAPRASIDHAPRRCLSLIASSAARELDSPFWPSQCKSPPRVTLPSFRYVSMAISLRPRHLRSPLKLNRS